MLAVREYYLDVETSIFNSWVDALLALIPLVILPLLSLLSVIFVDSPNFWNYTFPVMSICIAGAYDSYGRYIPGHVKNIKLGIRVFVEVIVVVLSASLQHNNIGIRLIPVILLLLMGLFFIYEVFIRVKTQIESSAWYRKGVEKHYVFKK